jgi:hypothetical protein
LAKSFKTKGYFKNYSQIKLMHLLKRKLHIDKNPEALKAYNIFLNAEFFNKQPKINDRISAIYMAFNRKKSDTERYDILEFKKFLSKLDLRYLKHNKRSFITVATSDIEHWYRKPLRAIINRITTLENERAKVYPEHQTIATATNIAAWAGSGLVKKRNGFDILPMNVPRDKGKATLRTTLRLLQNKLATDMKNGGFTAGYSSYWYKDMNILNGLEAKLSYNHSENVTDFARMDMNAFKEYDDFIKFGIGASFFGDMEGSFYKKDSAYGFNTYVDFMDIFRLTYVKRYGDIEDCNYLYFGIENIPSLLYWLNR